MFNVFTTIKDWLINLFDSLEGFLSIIPMELVVPTSIIIAAAIVYKILGR